MVSRRARSRRNPSVDRRRTRDPNAGHANTCNRPENMVQGGVLIGADPDPSYVKLQREVKDLVRISRGRTLDADLHPRRLKHPQTTGWIITFTQLAFLAAQINDP